MVVLLEVADTGIPQELKVNDDFFYFKIITVLVCGQAFFIILSLFKGGIIMCRKLIFLISFLLALGLVLPSVANAQDPNLVGWWTLDEGSGTIAYDSSIYGNDGTIVGDPEWVLGWKNGALDFDGDGDYIDCGDDESLEVGNEITVGVWVNLRTITISYMTVVAKGEYSWRLSTQATASAFHFGINYWQIANSSITPKGAVGANEWHHIAGTYDGATIRLYYDGELNNSLTSTAGIGTNEANVRIGTNPEAVDRYWDGLADEVRIYNRALTAEEINAEMIEPQYKATAPDPYDKSTIGTTEVLLSWIPGDTVASHHVYIGEIFEDVNAGTGGTDKGTVLNNFYSPVDLETGKTYYWRIDEIETGGSPVHKGDVWSFTILNVIASDPTPADGDICIDPNVLLEWTAGAGAVRHHVYFGDNFEDVNDGTGDTDQGVVEEPNFATGVLDFDTTYYWRIDEDDDANVYTGEIWSFTTATASMGALGEYYNNQDLADQPVLTRVDYAIDFPMQDGSPHPLINNDGFSIRWTTDLEPPFTETYTFITVTDDGVRLWVNDELIIDDWKDHASTENTGTIDLVAGQKVPLIMEYYEGGAGATVSLSWQSPSISREVVPACVLSLPSRALAPNPANVATDVERDPILSWTSGLNADTHNVYFGTDFDEVNDANLASDPNVAFTNVDVNSYDPGILQLNTIYYWRVDEVNDAHPDRLWRGAVWSFTTGNFLVVEDFEVYKNDPVQDRIWCTWKDGMGYGQPPPEPPPYYPGNDTGSAVGHWPPDPDIVETTIVHGGGQSMPYWYTNDGSTGKALYSESERTFDPPQDWTAENMRALTLWFYGDPNNDANATEQLYVKVNSVKVPYDGDMNDIREPLWHEWNIDLADFGAVTNVTTLAIGFGDAGNATLGGTGKVYFDDIRLYLSRCVPSKRQPVGDFDDDCDVDHDDLDAMATDWLITDYTADPLIAWYKFDEGAGMTAVDSSTYGNDGNIVGDPSWVTGYIGSGALDFNSTDVNDYVDLGDDEMFNPSGSFSIALWAYITGWTDEWSYAMVSRRGEDDVGWQLRRDSTDSLCFTTRGVDSNDVVTEGAPPLNQWIHIAAVYDKANSEKRIYVDGVIQVVAGTTAGKSIAPSTHNVYIGARANSDNTGPDGPFNGMLDDVRIYNKALSQAGILSIMDGTLGSVSDYHPVSSPAELYEAEAQNSRAVNFSDFAIFAEEWFDDVQMWP